MKIAIIGYSGSGKSTLAKRLAQDLGVEPLYLDRVYFLPNWQRRDEAEAQHIVRQTMEKPGWVIDGNYRCLLKDERLENADEIIFLDYPRFVCLFRALGRYFAFRNRTRESAADGCMEKMDWEFVWWILHKGRTKSVRRSYCDIVSRYPEKTAVIRTDRALKTYLYQRIRGEKT
jgi:adenylate kinase family enzyme